MTYDNEDVTVFNIVKNEILKELRKRIAVLSRSTNIHPSINKRFVQGLADRLMKSLHGGPPSGRVNATIIVDDIKICIMEFLNRMFNEIRIANDLRKSRDEIDILRHLPPVQRQRKLREKPMSLVEERHQLTKEKVRDWERKLKLAKTKLAKYKKKLAYYERREKADA